MRTEIVKNAERTFAGLNLDQDEAVELFKVIINRTRLMGIEHGDAYGRVIAALSGHLKLKSLTVDSIHAKTISIGTLSTSSETSDDFKEWYLNLVGRNL